MKIVVETDDGKELTFLATDAYLCLRHLEPTQNGKGQLAYLPETKSYSWGSNVRELVKELDQSLYELRDFLRGSPK